MSSERTLRILYVAPYRPSEIRVRAWLLLAELRKRHRVDIISLIADRSAPSIWTDERAEIYSLSKMDRLRAIPAFLDPSKPFQVALVQSRQMKEAVHSAVRTRCYDIIHVEHLRGLQFVPLDVMSKIGVFDAVDCVSELFISAVRHQRPWIRPVFLWEAARLRRYEQSAESSAKVLVASSRDELALRRIIPRGNISVLPNPVDLDRFHPQVGRRDKTVVFTGKMSFHANHNAAEWLCDSIWPLVEHRHPDARLVIAGAGPRRSLLRRQRAGVSVPGYVTNLSELIGTATVSVAPLKYATGIQNKVLEAMASATPVVATSAAVGDLNLLDGVHALVADGAPNIARSISALLSDRGLARRVGAMGRKYVEGEYSPEQIVNVLEQQYGQVLARDASVGLYSAARGGSV